VKKKKKKKTLDATSGGRKVEGQGGKAQ